MFSRADATKSQIERLVEGGAYAYLTKPLDLSEFFQVVGEATSICPLIATEQAIR